MGEWKEYKLSDITEIIGGGTPKTTIPEYWDGNIPWLSVVDFNNGRKIVFDTEKKITEKGLQKSSTKILTKGQIIISARGTVGALAVLGRDMAFNQSCYGLNAKEKLTFNDYLYYLVKDNVSFLLSNTHGAVFDTITRETFNHITVLLPPLPEQKVIASILSSLDEKIDLLHRQNKTLEALAETLFRQWFVEEAEEGWKTTSLFDVIDLIGGGTPKTEVAEYWGGDIKWISARDITPNHKGFITETEKTITGLGLERSSTKILPKYSTVISARGTVGKYCLLSEDMAFSQSNYGIKPKYKDCYFFTYLLVANSVDELQAAAYGSVFDTITTNTFKEHKIQVPLESGIISFEKRIRPYFEKMLINCTQIRTLTRLRDTLLPKLMSGEVRVKEG
jgi:type I restriction enzyme S subunit